MESDDPWLRQQKKVDEHFHETAWNWKSLYAGEGFRAQLYRDRQAIVLGWVDGLGLARGARVLEVGSGAGLLAVALARRGLRVHAVDRVPRMVELTRQHATESGATDALTVGVGDAADLAFRNDSFDLVVSVGVVTWLDRADRAIREMGRVTRPTGHVVFTAPNRAALGNVLDPGRSPVLAFIRTRMRAVLKRRERGGSGPGMRFHSRRSLEAAVADAALTTIQARTYGFRFSWFDRPVLPDSLATIAHRWLQRLSDRGAPALGSLGRTHFFMARKSPMARAAAPGDGPR
jgi:2-polyprenyl-3-methyl-5-hydroxy-6-metoxy-1,4-benzoquinol methylase